MGHVISPLSLRLGVSRKWSSTWHTMHTIDYRFALFHSLDLQSIFSNFYSPDSNKAAFFNTPEGLIISHFDLNFIFGRKVIVDFFIFDSFFLIFFKFFFLQIKSKFFDSLALNMEEIFSVYNRRKPYTYKANKRFFYFDEDADYDDEDYDIYVERLWDMDYDYDEKCDHDSEIQFKGIYDVYDFETEIQFKGAYEDYEYYVEKLWNIQDENSREYNDDSDIEFEYEEKITMNENDSIKGELNEFVNAYKKEEINKDDVKSKEEEINKDDVKSKEEETNKDDVEFKEEETNKDDVEFKEEETDKDDVEFKEEEANSFLFDYENFLSYILMNLLLYFDDYFLKTVLTSFSYTFKPFKELQFNYLPLSRDAITVNLLGYYICGRLALREEPKKIVIPLIKEFLQRPQIVGFKVVFCGRFSRKEIATYTWQKWGIVSTNTLVAKVDYGLYTINLKYGVCGVKVWLQQNDESPFFSLSSYKPLFLKFSR
jgi:Ribosomal protein S3, C-terminal domain